MCLNNKGIMILSQLFLSALQWNTAQSYEAVFPRICKGHLVHQLPYASKGAHASWAHPGPDKARPQGCCWESPHVAPAPVWCDLLPTPLRLLVRVTPTANRRLSIWPRLLLPSLFLSGRYFLTGNTWTMFYFCHLSGQDTLENSICLT